MTWTCLRRPPEPDILRRTLAPLALVRLRREVKLLAHVGALFRALRAEARVPEEMRRIRHGDRVFLRLAKIIKQARCVFDESCHEFRRDGRVHKVQKANGDESML